MSTFFRLPHSIVAMAILAILTACSSTTADETVYSNEDRLRVENQLKGIGDVDSLRQMAASYKQRGDLLGEMMAQRFTGELCRAQSRFNWAMKHHEEALKLARQANDTLEMIRDLNDLAANRRRQGRLNEAADLHLEAFMLSRRQADQISEDAVKNRVKALNGLGNIYLKMGNVRQADSVLRLALAGERQAGNVEGQAVNLATLGTIKERQGETDSAWIYYRQAMNKNEECGSQLGIALCHDHFGHLLEGDHLLDKALEKYEQALQTIPDEHDDWHRLEIRLDIARIYIAKGELARANALLEDCIETAHRIGSLEHRIATHKLFYELYEKQGNLRRALDNYIAANELDDSLIGMSRVMQIQNARVAHERQLRNAEMLTAMNDVAEARQQRQKSRLLLGGLLVLALTGIGILWHVLRTRTMRQRLLRHLNEAREQFFTYVAHEFRTPLTVILGLGRQLEQVKSTDDVEKIQSSAKMIVRQGDSLLNLINMLLEISKIRSAGGGEPHWQRGNIVTYVGMTLQSFESLAMDKSIEISYTHSLTSIEMDFAPDYVQKIMSNLMSNAIKFTPEHGKINVTVEPTGDNYVKLQVFDTGQGIPPEALPHIFDAFYQGDQQDTSIGTGIGLSLVKLMTEAMGGSVHAESIVNQGSTFTVTLPMKHQGSTELQPLKDPEIPKIPENQENPEMLEIPGNRSTQASRILIVEDNQDIAKYIGMCLRQYQLMYARTGAEALQKAQDTVPDLVITDLMMPGAIDGLMLCRSIRNSDLLSHLPIVIITAKTSEADRIKGIEAGADAYLVKPFDQDELLVRVEKLLERQQLLRQKFIELHVDQQDKERPISAADRQFMNQLIDNIYVLMAQGNVDVESLAQRMALSRTQVNRRVLTITGQNTSSYVMNVRLSRAKRLLKADIQKPVGDVALKCGFDDVAYFSRVFKQTFDVTPTQYRKQC